MFKSIQSKFIFWAGISLVLVAVVVICLAAMMLRSTAIENAKSSTLEIARQEAATISAQLSDALDIARTLEQAIIAEKIQQLGLTREQIDGMLEEVFVRNPDLIGTWTAWEPNAFDGKDDEYRNTPGYDKTGRFIVYWNRDAEGNIKRELVVDYEDEALAGWYFIPMKTLQETVIDPYLYVVQGKETLLTSFAIPIVIDNQFYGVVGVDFSLNHVQGLIDNLKLEYADYSEITLISQSGKIVGASGHPELFGQDLSTYHENWQQEVQIIQNQQITLEENGGILSVYAPVKIGKTTTPWSINMNIPYEVITADATQLTLNLIGVGGLMIVIGLVMLWFVARQVVQPIKEVTVVAQAIINGDLNREVRVNSQDETGVLANAFNQMIHRLREMLNDEQSQREYLQMTVEDYASHMNRIGQGNLKDRLDIEINDDNRADPLIMLGYNLNEMTSNLQNVIQQVQQVALRLNMTSTEIQSAITQQTASVIEQDATIAQTVATVEEIRTGVAQTAEVAQNVARASQQSVEVSRHGQQAVLASIEGMNAIGQRVQSIAETILLLSKHTQQIGEITDSVNEIAEQSKLLALNASIEAARAGEEGKGFSVVAMEVRQLAEQSRDATIRIRGILNQIQQATNTAVMVTEEGNKGTEKGMALVQQAGTAIQNLAEVIQQASQAAIQIASRTHEQTNGMDQLAIAMTQIKQASLQSTAGIRQTELSIRELTGTANSLEEMTAAYTL